MKLAWLCYEHDDNFDCGYDPNRAEIVFGYFDEDGVRWKYAKMVQIVYTEIVKEE